MIEAASRITVLAGAGLSTECGVPDFRTPGSPWRTHAPIGFADFMASPALRAEAWRRKFAMDDLYAGAVPGRGHRALTRLEQAGRLRAIITQNIDGLQQAAGFPSEKLIELHGNGTYARCLSCGAPHELAPIRSAFFNTGTLPRCGCGGIVKSGSIAFGQPIAPDDLRRALEAACACDLFIVVGSSLLVRPASRLPELARRRGAGLVIVNRDATMLDDEADLVIREDIGSVLAAL